MAVDSIISSAVSQITGAIQKAAQSTGISFEYLLTTARMESNLNPSAQASTSSAKGLYQFIDQTWLATMKQEGAGLGYGRYADAITQGTDGRYQVANPDTRAEIMKLRNDPTASAALAGAFSRHNAVQVAGAIGRQPTEGELYIAHFLGPDGAGRMINAATSSPQASAAGLFPAAAAANRSIFYDKAGDALSVADTYAKLTGRFEAARVAQFGPSRSGPVAAGTTAVAQLSTSDTAGIAAVYAAADAQAQPVLDNKPLFQAMFTDRAGAPVAPVVNSLWGGQAASAAPARGLDLFSDGATDIRRLFGNG